MAARDVRRTAERKAAGLCITCGEAPATIRNRCQPCHDIRQAYPSQGTNATRAARRAAGTCIECGLVEVFEVARCDGCRAVQVVKDKARREERKKAKRCISCPKKAVRGRTRCVSCSKKRRVAWAEAALREAA